MPVRKRSKGSWEIYLDAGRDPGTGRRLRHYETIRGTKREAQQRLAELEVSIERGAYIKSPIPSCIAVPGQLRATYSLRTAILFRL